MDLNQITPLVLTYNESANIEACLRSLNWANEVLVVDSFSHDDTVAQASRFSNVRVVQRKFDVLAVQWNFGLHSSGIVTPWILALDADYLPTPDLLDEIRRLEPAADVSAYRVPFTYCVFGRPLRGSMYGPVAVLFRREQADYVQDGHAHRLRLRSGSFASLKGRMLHDDRKPLGRFLTSQDLYMRLEVQKLREAHASQLSWADRLRRQVVLAPVLMFVYCLFVQGAIFDGWAGWYYALQRLTAELVLSLKLIEARLCWHPRHGASQPARPEPTMPSPVPDTLPGDRE